MELTGRPALVVAGVAAAAVAAGGAALAVGVPSAPSHPLEQVAALPADGHSGATLEIRSGTPLLDIKVANLGGTSGTLLRASVPGDAPPPVITVASGGGRERSGKDELVFLSGSDGASAVTVTLNAAVTWRLDFAGGTERTAADLRGGRVAAITVAAGSDIVDLALPRPRGTVPVLLSGGASQFLLSLPGGVPVRVISAGGAGEVSLDGATHTGVGGGSVFATPGWTAGTPAAPRFDVDATAGAARVSVTRWGG
jgi:hypothetical protein